MTHKDSGLDFYHKDWLNLYSQLPDYQPAKLGDFELKNREIAKGTKLRGYDHHKGELFLLEYATPFSIAELRQGEDIWMSTTQLELEGLIIPVRRAKGRVFTSGLGLGCFAWLAALKSSVSSVTVVEQSQEVIDLIMPQLMRADPKIAAKIRPICSPLEYHWANCEDKYEFIYLDIWGSLLGPLKDALKAKAAAEPFRAHRGEIRLWLQELIDRVLKQLPKEAQPLSSLATIQTPCLVCSKIFRFDFAGLCMDCADELELSNLYVKRGA